MSQQHRNTAAGTQQTRKIFSIRKKIIIDFRLFSACCGSITGNYRYTHRT